MEGIEILREKLEDLEYDMYRYAEDSDRVGYEISEFDYIKGHTYLMENIDNARLELSSSSQEFLINKLKMTDYQKVIFIGLTSISSFGNVEILSILKRLSDDDLKVILKGLEEHLNIIYLNGEGISILNNIKEDLVI